MKKTKKDGIISLAFSYIKGYKKNTVLSIMGIAFSVTLMFSLLQMGERVLLQFRHMIGDYPTADFQIRNFDFDELDEIYSWLEEHHSEYTMYKKATYASGLAPNGMTAIIIEGVEGAWKELPPREFIAGKEPEKYGEICVEEKYCAMLGKTPEELVGESLKLTVHDDDYKEHEITYRISGILSDSGVNSDTYYMQTTYETAVTDVEKYHFQYDRNGNSISMLLDKYKQSVDQDVELQMEIAGLFGKDKYFYKDHIWNNPVRSEKFEGEGMYEDTASAFGGVAALISLCLVLFVYHTINSSITEKIRQYGIMRCMGLSSKNLLKLMGAETSFYAVFGLVLGVLAGNLLNRMVCGPILGTLLNIELADYPDGVFSYLFTAALTVLAVFLAFFVFYLKIRKLEPVEMMQFMETGKINFAVRPDIKGKKLLSVMAVRNLKRSKSRTRTLFSILVLSGVIIMVLVNVVGTINFKSMDMRGHFSRYEVSSNFIDDKYIFSEQVMELKQNGEVNSVYWQKFSNDVACEPDFGNRYDTNLYVYSDNLFDKFLELNKISVPEEEAGVVVSYGDSGYRCDSMTLRYAGLKDTDRAVTFTVPVKEILYDEYGNSLLGGFAFSAGESAYLIVSEKLAEKIYAALGDEESLYHYTDILVDCTEGADESTLYSMLGNEVSILDLKAFADNTEGQLMGMGAIAVYVLLAVSVLGILIINSIIKTNIVNREKEIGMMRSIGAEDKLMKKLLQKEIMTLAVMAVITSCMIAFPVSLYLAFMMNDRLQITVTGYFAGAIIVLGGCYLLTKRAVKKNLTNRNISRMLRQE